MNYIVLLFFHHHLYIVWERAIWGTQAVRLLCVHGGDKRKCTQGTSEVALLYSCMQNHAVISDHARKPWHLLCMSTSNRAYGKCTPFLFFFFSFIISSQWRLLQHIYKNTNTQILNMNLRVSPDFYQNGRPPVKIRTTS